MNMNNKVRLTESELHMLVQESVMRILKEYEEFKPHAYKATSNYGGNELQVSDSGDAARIKFQNGEVTDWLEIDFDENGVAYVTTPDGDQERLDEYIRVNAF